MRILYDSKKLIHKDPFGTLVPDQLCTLNIHIPSSVQATKVECIISREDGSHATTASAMGILGSEGLAYTATVNRSAT